MFWFQNFKTFLLLFKQPLMTFPRPLSTIFWIYLSKFKKFIKIIKSLSSSGITRLQRMSNSVWIPHCGSIVRNRISLKNKTDNNESQICKIDMDVQWTLFTNQQILIEPPTSHFLFTLEIDHQLIRLLKTISIKIFKTF